MSRIIANTIINKLKTDKTSENFTGSGASSESVQITRKLVIDENGNNSDEIIDSLRGGIYLFYDNFISPNLIVLVPIVFVLIFVIVKYYTKKNKKNKFYKTAYKKYKKEKSTK